MLNVSVTVTSSFLLTLGLVIAPSAIAAWVVIRLKGRSPLQRKRIEDVHPLKLD